MESPGPRSGTPWIFEQDEKTLGKRLATLRSCWGRPVNQRFEWLNDVVIIEGSARLPREPRKHNFPRRIVDRPDFRYLDLSSVPGGAATACERLPPAPAVYAFFRKLDCPSGDPTTFLETVHAAIDAPAAPQHSSRVGPLHSVTLQSHSVLSPLKSERLRRLAALDSFRQYLAHVLERAALLQAPLYVGKADSLQLRIKQHLEPTSDLSSRLRGVGLNLDRAVLAYALMDTPEDWNDEVTLTLVEEILTRICRPGYVARIG